MIDTTTGQVAKAAVSLPDCGSALFAPSADGNELYVTCLGSNDVPGSVRFINLRTNQVEYQIGLSDIAPTAAADRIVGSSVAHNGNQLYVVTTSFQLAVIDVKQHTILQRVHLLPQERRSVFERAVALTPDGTRLFIGVSTAQDSAVTDDIRIFDTQNWQAIDRLRLGQPISASSLIARADGRSIFGIQAAPLGQARTITDSSADQQTAARTAANQLLIRKGEDVLRVFTSP